AAEIGHDEPAVAPGDTRVLAADPVVGRGGEQLAAEDQAARRDAKRLDRRRRTGPDHHRSRYGRGGGLPISHRASIPSLQPATGTVIEPLAVTFDAGQTVIDLDLAFLARRLAERGVVVERAALAAAAPAAWQHYDRLVDPAGGHPWRELMANLLAGAGIAAEQIPALVEWLWAEQPRANLWRAEIPGMVALARELRARGVP